MKLYLARHGLALPSGELSNEGQAQVRTMAHFLEGHPIDVIFHSTKLRARQTAEILKGEAPLLEKEDLSPMDPVDTILSEISCSDQNVMIVSHLPFLESLLSRLLSVSGPAPFCFTEGAIACLEGSGAKWSLVWALAPAYLFSYQKNG